MLCSIYKITNNINNKIYIGQTWSSIKQRFSEHSYAPKRCKTHLANAFRKYGSKEFNIELGYNLNEGGSYGKHSPESIEKTRQGNLGQKRDNEFKAKRKLHMLIHNPNNLPGVKEKQSLARKNYWANKRRW